VHTERPDSSDARDEYDDGEWERSTDVTALMPSASELLLVILVDHPAALEYADESDRTDSLLPTTIKPRTCRPDPPPVSPVVKEAARLPMREPAVLSAVSPPPLVRSLKSLPGTMLSPPTPPIHPRAGGDIASADEETKSLAPAP
jgi:hypothetical protein